MALDQLRFSVSALSREQISAPDMGAPVRRKKERMKHAKPMRTLNEGES